MFVRLFLFSLFLFPFFHAHAQQEAAEKIIAKIIVSVAPIKKIVEKIAGDSVTCVLFVPPGTSPHSYEPTLRQIVENENALIWFRIGENFESRIVKLLASKMVIIDLRNNLPLLSSRCCCQHIDTHIWLSPRLLKIQSQNILDALSQLFPEKRELFEANFNKLREELDQLDQNISQLLKNKAGKAFLVSHPAFGYFCQDFHLKELSIEIEGKEPTPRQITHLLEEAKEEKVTLVITQPQYSNRGAKILAKQLDAKLVSFDPYEENVLDNLKFLSQILADD